MHLQGDVCVFCCILRCSCNIQLGKGALLYPFATNLFEGNGLVAEMALGKRIEIMARLACVQDKTLEHRILHISCDMEAVAVENMQIVFAILRNLMNRGVCKHRAQPRDDHRTIELCFRFAATVPKRKIGGVARRVAKADPDEFGV